MKPLRFATSLLSLCAALAAVPAWAQTTITDVWTRTTVPQQKASAVFMQLTAAKDSTLLSASSPVAGTTEIHEMKMEGYVVKMTAMANGLPLPAGKMVALTPSGYHIMLMDLKQQIKVGDNVPLTLVVRGADGKDEVLTLQAEVKDMAQVMRQQAAAQKAAQAASQKR